MLRKGTIPVPSTEKGISKQSVPSRKKEQRSSPSNLKNLSNFLPYQHFKMKDLNSLEGLLQEGDYIWKLYLKDAYFRVSLHRDLRKLFQFLWEENHLYELLCLCFSVNLAPRLLSKIMKVHLAILRRLSIAIVIYLNNMFLIGGTMEETIITRDSVFFLLQTSSHI